MSETAESKSAEVSAARGLIRQGHDLAEAGRDNEAIATWDIVVERFGGVPDIDVRHEVARALLGKGYQLDHLDRYEEAIAVYDELEARYGGKGESVRVREAVAQGLLNRAITLGRMDRHQEEIEAYDDLVARYGASDDSDTRAHVAWALYDKAITLADLERPEEAVVIYEQLIASFRDTDEVEIRPRVSWALWKASLLLDELGRSEDCAPLHEEVIERRDEALDRRLGEFVLWCLWEKQAKLGRDGAADAQLAVLDDVILRFANSSEEDQQRTVISAYETKAYILDGVDEIACYDDALALLDRFESSDRTSRLINLLICKGVALSRSDRNAEAVVVFDSALAAYFNGVHPEARASDTTALVLEALLQKIVVLATLGHGDALARIRDQLAEILGDVAVPHGDDLPDDARCLSEPELAALLAEVHGGECWLWFATADNDESTRELMAERALELYRQTEPWLSGAGEIWDEPPALAAFLLRNIADGYAILSRWWSDRDRTTLALPARSFFEWAVNLAGIEEWAAEQGHPLELRESGDAVEIMFAEERTKILEELGNEDADRSRRVAEAFVAAAHVYDVFSILADSRRGREAAGAEPIRWFTAWRLSNTRYWVAWARDRVDDVGGATLAMLLMTESCFVISHGGVSSSAEIFPSRADVNALFDGTDAGEWLGAQDADVPSWLFEDDE